MTRFRPFARLPIGVAAPMLVCIACSDGDPAGPTGGPDEASPPPATIAVPGETIAPPDAPAPREPAPAPVDAVSPPIGILSIEDDTSVTEPGTRLFAVWLRGNAPLDAAPLTASLSSGDRCTAVGRPTTPEAEGLRVASLPDLSIVITTAAGTWATTRESVIAGTALHRLPGAGSTGPDRLPEAVTLDLVGNGFDARSIALPAAPASVPLPRFEPDGTLVWAPGSADTRLIVQVDDESVAYRCELDDDGRTELDRIDGLPPTLDAPVVTRVARLRRAAPGASTRGPGTAAGAAPLVIERSLARAVRVIRSPADPRTSRRPLR